MNNQTEKKLFQQYRSKKNKLIKLQIKINEIKEDLAELQLLILQEEEELASTLSARIERKKEDLQKEIADLYKYE